MIGVANLILEGTVAVVTDHRGIVTSVASPSVAQRTNFAAVMIRPMVIRLITAGAIIVAFEKTGKRTKNAEVTRVM